MAIPKKVESHSSNLNNQRIITLLIMIDSAAIKAGSLNFNSIQAYYNVVEQVYLNTKDIYTDSQIIDDIADIRKKYHFFYDLLIQSQEYQGVKTLLILYRISKKFNSLIITALQKDLEFFFRIGLHDRKGLKEIKFYDDSNAELTEKEINEVLEDDDF